MPIILSLDTSSDNCSVALYHNSKLLLECQPAPRKHTQLILPMVQSIVKENSLGLKDLDAIAFGCGPGSFTGIRIAAGVAQGLAFGLDCPVYPVSNLEALALQACREYAQGDRPMLVLVAIDARMDEVYWSLCLIEKGLTVKTLTVKTLIGECVSKPESIDLSMVDQIVFQKCILIGAGSGFEFVDRFPDAVRESLSSFDSTARPKADAICELGKLAFEGGESGRLADALPSYVRDTVTWKKLPGRE